MNRTAVDRRSTRSTQHRADGRCAFAHAFRLLSIIVRTGDAGKYRRAAGGTLRRALKPASVASTAVVDGIQRRPSMSGTSDCRNFLHSRTTLPYVRTGRLRPVRRPHERQPMSLSDRSAGFVFSSDCAPRRRRNF